MIFLVNIILNKKVDLPFYPRTYMGSKHRSPSQWGWKFTKINYNYKSCYKNREGMHFLFSEMNQFIFLKDLTIQISYYTP